MRAVDETIKDTHLWVKLELEIRSAMMRRSYAENEEKSKEKYMMTVHER